MGFSARTEFTLQNSLISLGLQLPENLHPTHTFENKLIPGKINKVSKLMEIAMKLQEWKPYENNIALSEWCLLNNTEKDPELTG